jgi:hypothetical protein
MVDNVLNNFIEKQIIEGNIDEGIFSQYIEVFSRFLGYINPDYKYNGTYLSQYKEDFKQVCGMLKCKNKKYDKIVQGLLELGIEFELIIDRIYYVKFSRPNVIEKYYLSLNKSQILKQSIEVKITTQYCNREYSFCKEYENLEDDLSKRVGSDIKKYFSMKNRGIINGIKRLRTK